MSDKEKSPLQIVNGIINQARSAGLVHRVDEGETHDGHTVRMDGKELLNFGSCGYMSLEFDSRVRAGAMEAIEKYGMVFNSSRTYISNSMYPMLEDLLEKILRRPAVIAPTTTLLHLAALPVLVEADDVVLLDQQVHSSVQLTAKVLKANGAVVEIVPHNSLSRIEKKIKAYKDVKKKIWYLGDGVYSMYGDFAPVKELEQLLETYEQFHVYLDDAHGMSWTGERGTGYVLENMKHHDRLYVAVGLAKGFGTGGGAIACPNREIKQLIRNCGGTQFFAGPMQPTLLGAAVASAKIHLSSEFGEMQAELMDRIRYMTEVMENQQPLPLMSSTESPIRFLGVGQWEKAHEIIQLLMKDGFWLNIAQYPAVAPQHTGVRFMLTRKIQKKDIDLLGEAMKRAVDKVFGKDEEAISQVWKTFKKDYRYSLTGTP